MTNEQLRLLIRAYADRLELEIDNARSQLPDDSERANIGSAFVDLEPGEFVALLGLNNFLRDLRKADEDLAQVKEESTKP